MAKTQAELEAMGLPATFTPEDLRGTFSKAEIAALSEGDDAIFEAADIPDDMKTAGKQPTAFEAAKGWVEPKVADKDDTDTAEGDDDVADDPDGKADGAADDDGDDAGDAGEGQGEGDDGDDAGDAGDAPDQGKDDAAAAEPAIVLPETLNEPDPEVQWADTTEMAKAIEEMDGKLVDLNARYDDGELTAAEFREEQKKVVKEQAKAQADLDRATERNTQASESIGATWDKKVGAFADANPAFVDTTPIKGLTNGESARDVFDGALRYVTANAAALKAGTMADQIRIAAEMADRYVFVNAGVKIVTGGQTKPPADGKKADKDTGPRKDKRPEPPVTLHGKTAVAETDVREDKYAHLDAIEDPIEYETAIGKLTDAERKEFLGG